MKLYLVQHGEAVPEEINPERPLSEKGISDVKKIALFLKQSGASYDTIFHSNKKRAIQTAQLLAEIVSENCRLIQKEKLSPNDPIDYIYKEIQAQDKDLMIVGHLPFLAKLSSKLLIGSEEKHIIGFKQGSILLLERSDGNWQIKWFIIPDLL